MKEQLHFYDIYPKVVLAGMDTQMTIKALDRHCNFIDGNEYDILIMPINEPENVFLKNLKVIADNRGLVFTGAFEGEQEYKISITRPEDSNPLVQLDIYSVFEDLYDRYPFKGDLHSHTFYSDGIESPEFVAAYYRMHGYDFLSITDHYKWEPSRMAIDFYSGTGADLKLIEGEEVHAPGNEIHIVNFGGNKSINEIWQSDEYKYREEVDNIIKHENIQKRPDAFVCASCIWVSERIRLNGGLSILCHPHWMPWKRGYSANDSTFFFLLEFGCFDAWEIVGATDIGRNNTMVGLYTETIRRGIDIPVVGCNDSHGVVDGSYFNKAKTIVLAGSNSKSDIMEAVKAGMCAGVEAFPGEVQRVYGNYRIVKYLRFLLDNYFPIHDNLCFNESLIMKDYICGVSGTKEELERVSGRTEEFRKHIFRGAALEYIHNEEKK